MSFESLQQAIATADPQYQAMLRSERALKIRQNQEELDSMNLADSTLESLSRKWSGTDKRIAAGESPQAPIDDKSFQGVREQPPMSFGRSVTQGLGALAANTLLPGAGLMAPFIGSYLGDKAYSGVTGEQRDTNPFEIGGSALGGVVGTSMGLPLTNSALVNSALGGAVGSSLGGKAGWDGSEAVIKQMRENQQVASPVPPTLTPIGGATPNQAQAAPAALSQAAQGGSPDPEAVTSPQVVNGEPSKAVVTQIQATGFNPSNTAHLVAAGEPVGLAKLSRGALPNASEVQTLSNEATQMQSRIKEVRGRLNDLLEHPEVLGSKRGKILLESLTAQEKYLSDDYEKAATRLSKTQEAKTDFMANTAMMITDTWERNPQAAKEQYKGVLEAFNQDIDLSIRSEPGSNGLSEEQIQQKVDTRRKQVGLPSSLDGEQDIGKLKTFIARTSKAADLIKNQHYTDQAGHYQQMFDLGLAKLEAGLQIAQAKLAAGAGRARAAGDSEYVKELTSNANNMRNNLTGMEGRSAALSDNLRKWEETNLRPKGNWGLSKLSDAEIEASTDPAVVDWRERRRQLTDPIAANEARYKKAQEDLISYENKISELTKVPTPKKEGKGVPPPKSSGVDMNNPLLR